MQSKVPLQQQIIYILLILSAGVIGPVSYFDAYSPHQVANTYHISIMEDPTDLGRVAALFRQKQQQQRLQRAFDWRGPQQSALSRTIVVPNFAKTLQLAVTAYTLADVVALQANQQCLACKLPDTFTAASSADLSPPEKPPPG